MPGLYIDPVEGAVKVQKCKGYKKEFGANDRTLFAPLFERIEEKYKCAGICSVPDKYIFSNIGNGTPKRTCKKYLVRELSENAAGFTDGLIALIVLVTLSGFLMTVFCLIRCKNTWCKKKDKGKKKKKTGETK